MVIFPAKIIMLVPLLTHGKIILELHQNYCIHFFQEKTGLMFYASEGTSPSSYVPGSCLLQAPQFPLISKISFKSSPTLEANSTNAHHSLARLMFTVHLPGQSVTENMNTTTAEKFSDQGLL
jgi:hypothetical protein